MACRAERIRKFWYFMLDFFYVISWQFCSYLVVDISWTIPLSLIPNLFSHMVLSCWHSSGLSSKLLPVFYSFTSGLSSMGNEIPNELLKSLICLFCYWRHIMQIKSVNNLLGVICCPELTASCVSAASEMELNLG